MSQENVELIYRANDAFNRRDLDAFLALVDPDAEVTSPIAELEGGRPYRGHDGIRSWWEDLLGVSPDVNTEVDEVRDLGDVTVARVRLRGRGIESDAPLDQTTWQVAEWRYKKCVVRLRIFLSEADALEAAGLSE
jgi:ketosteroid isomerase-like protein